MLGLTSAYTCFACALVLLSTFPGAQSTPLDVDDQEHKTSNGACVTNFRVANARLTLSWDPPKESSSETVDGSKLPASYTVLYKLDSPQAAADEWYPVEGCERSTSTTCNFQAWKIGLWHTFLLTVQTTYGGEILQCPEVQLRVRPMEYRLLPTPQFNVTSTANKLFIYPRAADETGNGKSYTRTLKQMLELNYQVQFNATVEKQHIESKVFEIPAERCGVVAAAESTCCVRLRIVEPNWLEVTSDPFSESNWTAWQCITIKSTGPDRKLVTVAALASAVSICVFLVSGYAAYRLYNLYQHMYKDLPKLPETLEETMRDDRTILCQQRDQYSDINVKEKYDVVPLSFAQRGVEPRTRQESNSTTETTLGSEIGDEDSPAACGAVEVHCDPEMEGDPGSHDESPIYVTMAAAFAQLMAKRRTRPDSYGGDVDAESGILVDGDQRRSFESDEHGPFAHEEWREQPDSGLSLWHSRSSSYNNTLTVEICDASRLSVRWSPSNSASDDASYTTSFDQFDSDSRQRLCSDLTEGGAGALPTKDDCASCREKCFQIGDSVSYIASDLMASSATLKGPVFT